MDDEAKTRIGIDLGTVPVWHIQATPEPRWDICEFLLVDKKDPRIFYCGLARDQVDVAFKPCLLPPEERLKLCPVYRKHYADRLFTGRQPL
jgi:hypothetical protein